MDALETTFPPSTENFGAYMAVPAVVPILEFLLQTGSIILLLSRGYFEDLVLDSD